MVNSDELMKAFVIGGEKGKRLFLTKNKTEHAVYSYAAGKG